MEISPSPWIFILIWNIIYGFIILQIIYTLTTFFRRGLHGEYMYVSPPLLPPLFFLANCVNGVMSTVWNATITQEKLVVSLVILAGMMLCVYVSVVTTAYQTEQYAEELTLAGCAKDVWIVRVLFLNGAGFYAAWLTIAFILGVGRNSAYRGNLDQSIASTMSLVLYGVVLASYFILDNFILKKYTRYIIGPYIVAILAFAGSMAQNWDPMKANSINTAALFGISCLGFLVKLFTITEKHRCKRNRVVDISL